MITSKQRSYLKGMANSLKPIVQLGKDGINEGFIRQIDIMLDDHELVKVNVLEGSMLGAKEAAFEVVEKTNCEFVQAIGRKFVIYRPSTDKEKEDKIRLPK